MSDAPRSNIRTASPAFRITALGHLLKKDAAVFLIKLSAPVRRRNTAHLSGARSPFGRHIQHLPVQPVHDSANGPKQFKHPTQPREVLQAGMCLLNRWSDRQRKAPPPEQAPALRSGSDGISMAVVSLVYYFIQASGEYGKSVPVFLCSYIFRFRSCSECFARSPGEYSHHTSGGLVS